MTIDLKDLLAKIEQNKQAQTGSNVPAPSAPAPAPSAPAPAPVDYWQPGDDLNDVQEYLQTKGKPLSLIALAADNPPPEDIAKSYDDAPKVAASKVVASKVAAPKVSDDFEDDNEETPEEKPKGRKCGNCGEYGHNARTCKAQPKDDSAPSDPLDALLAARSLFAPSAPSAPTPTPAPVAARVIEKQTPEFDVTRNHAIGTLFIDCIPMNKDFITLDNLFANVAGEISKGSEKPHFKLVEFGKGVGLVSALVEEKIHDWAQGRNVFVDSSSHYVSACMDVLIQNSGSVVRGIGR